MGEERPFEEEKKKNGNIFFGEKDAIFAEILSHSGEIFSY